MKWVALILVLGGFVGMGSAQAGRGATAGPGGPCRLFRLPAGLTREAEDNMLLDAYNAQAHLVRSLFVAAMVTPRSGSDGPGAGSRRPLPVLIQVVKPDLIHVTGPSRLSGDRGFEMASDGQAFHLLTPEDGRKVFVTGPPDAAVESKNLRENVRPQPFFDALLWQEGRLASGPPAPANGAMHSLRMELPPGGGGARSATIEFDLDNGVMRSFSAFDGSGTLLFEAKYGQWQEIETFSQTPQRGCFPQEIHLVRPGDNLSLDLHITQVDLNPAIPRSVFRMSTPKNIPVIYVDRSGHSVTTP